ncbi:iron ABC transporter substrate-binding protein [Mycobacterium adipatum]|uniref:Iron ABC transporter substrate-binding protein n=1 Tax=Mycobacterium adipatum TaxID=1682113 RepID=A0A172UGK6_9MYCO|nr:ABC transporter substrate-binding protein [Mycobacterium adipatum]ANE78075.1 iron ABC transporter substrate-binding protein [Mycobacterium adipatum]MBI5737930.1 ABC transporter substrate-binding protein [Mycolicibacterium neoaurum]
MPTTWSRRSFLLALAAGSAAAVTACRSEPPGAIAEDGSVTVDHAFGQTRVPAPPTRVISAGLTGQDCLLAVGVVPIAVTEWFGGQPFAVWPWALPALGTAQPAVLNLDGGIDVEAIAALDPDLIIATNAGLDQDTYTRLSDIAPTIAQAGQDAFFEPWKDQATAIGAAVFKHDQMQQLIADIDARFTTLGTETPAFKGKRALLLQGSLDDGELVTTPAGWRTEFLTQLGFEIPEVDATVPRDRMAEVLGGADVLIWAADDAETAILAADPVIAEQGARNVFTGRDLAAAIAFYSPLSLPLVADQLPAMLSTALA